jgi:hypothetical protein
MGLLAPGSANASPLAQPHINTSGNVFVHMFGRRGGKMKKCLFNFLAISGNSKQLVGQSRTLYENKL